MLTVNAFAYAWAGFLIEFPIGENHGVHRVVKQRCQVDQQNFKHSSLL